MSEVLRKAELLDGYVELCKRDYINSLARSRCSYVAWPDQSLAKEALAVLSRQEADEVQVVIMDPSAEGGMPHTREPNVICIPAYFPSSSLKTTMKHELIHIYQRRDVDGWNRRAQGEGWIRVKDTEIPENWRRRCRINPDTIDCRFFAWQGRWVPLPLFVREDKPELRDISVRWLDLKEGTVLSRVPTSFTQVYGDLSSSAIEHPYELWAYSLEKNG